VDAAREERVVVCEPVVAVDRGAVEAAVTVEDAAPAPRPVEAAWCADAAPPQAAAVRARAAAHTAAPERRFQGPGRRPVGAGGMWSSFFSSGIKTPIILAANGAGVGAARGWGGVRRRW
jgi:hypothetical protein